MLRRILLFLIFCLTSTSLGAHEGWGIQFDSVGNLYFTNIGNRAIWRFTPQDQLTQLFSDKWVHQIYVDAHDNLIMENEEAGSGWSSLIRYSPAGEQSYLVEPTNNRESFRGEGFAVDSLGNIYYEYNAVIYKREPNGTYYPYIGSGVRDIQDGYRRDAQFQVVWSMSLLCDGNIYVSDEDAIRRVTLDGEVTTVATGLLTDNPPDGPWGGNDFNFFLGVDMDPDGNLYVGYYANARVLKISPDGEISEFYFSGGDWYPMGVAYRDGELFVFETGHNSTRGPEHFRVSRISETGDAVTLIESGQVVSGIPEPVVVPNAISLVQNYPNPFNAGTTISFNLTEAAHIHLHVFAVDGSRVASLLHSRLNAGPHRIHWDGTNSNGLRVTSGSYYYKIETGGRSVVKSMILLK